MNLLENFVNINKVLMNRSWALLWNKIFFLNVFDEAAMENYLMASYSIIKPHIYFISTFE